MSANFVKNETIIDATQTIAVFDGREYRPAAIRGGYFSRTGLTLLPTWVEESAVKLLRKREFLLALLAGKEVEVEGYFTGHGAGEWEFHPVDLPALRAAVLAWQEFRQHGGTIPPADSEEERLARQATLGGFHEMEHLTAFEATELLPKWSTWASMEEEEPDPEDGNSITAHVWAERGYAHTPDVTTGVWHFTPEGYSTTWEYDGWSYRSQYSATDRRWYRTRTRTLPDGSLLFQKEEIEDSCEYVDD